MSANTDYHVAFVKNGNNYQGFLNGTSQGTNTDSTSIFTNSNTVKIGARNLANSLNGWIKEVRISDVARYTSNFTPATSQFTEDDNTVLLIHSDTSNYLSLIHI